MTVDVYENCPIYENEYYMLRMTNKEDKADLLKVYLMKNQYHFLIVIIVVEMIFTIQLKKEWNKRLNFGIGNMIDRDLSVGRLFQRKQMRRWVR